jgi:hypothetical protein
VIKILVISITSEGDERFNEHAGDESGDSVFDELKKRNVV